MLILDIIFFFIFHFFTSDRTRRILNAIDELYNLLLDSDDRHDLHADVMNELRDLRKRLQPIQPVQSANGNLIICLFFV